MYRIGQVPMFAVLTNLDVEALGFTRPTWSLGSPAEYRFRDANPAHYDVYDVRWVIAPDDRAAPIPAATVVTQRGRHILYEMPTDGPIDVVDVGAPLQADRTNLGVRIAPYLSSVQVAEHVVPSITFGAFAAAAPTVSPGETPSDVPGVVSKVHDRLEDGVASATVDLERAGAVILKTSFDNRWTVTVDGERLEPQMFAPGFVGRAVPAGRHQIEFRYAPFPRYDLLLLIGALTLVALFVIPRRRVTRAASPTTGSEP
jgi:hypothetical protein